VALLLAVVADADTKALVTLQKPANFQQYLFFAALIICSFVRAVQRKRHHVCPASVIVVVVLVVGLVVVIVLVIVWVFRGVHLCFPIQSLL